MSPPFRDLLKQNSIYDYMLKVHNSITLTFTTNLTLVYDRVMQFSFRFSSEEAVTQCKLNVNTAQF